MTGEELERYVRLYYSSVYSAALCRCKNRDDAYDIAQDVFLKLFVHEGSFTEDEHVKAWLLRCTLNRSNDLLRSYRHRAAEPNRTPAHDPREQFARTESSLIPALMKLGKKNRTVLYLHYYEGYSAEEIGDMLGVSVAAVRGRLLRGKNKLRKLLESEGY